MHVVRITKAGFNVLTETDPKNMIFDSTVNHAKTAQDGSFTQAVSSFSNTEVTVNHSLGIRPLALAYWRNTANSDWFIPMSTPEVTTTRLSTGSLNVEIYVTTTQVKFNLINESGSSKTFEVQYEIFYEGE